jgi:membrane protein YdbS with pleckstrin-like domain
MTPPPALREPAHQVSPRAIGFWRLTAALPALALGVALLVVVLLGLPVLTTVLPVAAAFAALVTYAALMPDVRFRVHRWEVTDTAVHTRSGWLAREERIAPLSRVQTVDAHQSALMRAFGLKSITVTTASAAGPVLIDCLDAAVADRTVAELTEITGRTRGDAT